MRSECSLNSLWHSKAAMKLGLCWEPRQLSVQEWGLFQCNPMRIPENAKCTTSHAQAPAPRPTALASQAKASAHPGDSVTRVQTPSQHLAPRWKPSSAWMCWSICTWLYGVHFWASVHGSDFWSWVYFRVLSLDSWCIQKLPVMSSTVGAISRSCVLMQQVLGVPWPPSDFTTAAAENSIHLRAPHLN